MRFAKKNLLLAGLFLGALVVVSSQMGRCGLCTSQVLHFEFAYFCEPDVSAFVEKWNATEITPPSPSGLRNRLDAMRCSTKKDFIFIGTYVFFLVFLGRAAAGPGRFGQARAITLMMLGAGLSDVVENLQILWLLEHVRGLGLRPLLMTSFASLKFLLLLLSVGWIVKLFFTKEA